MPFDPDTGFETISRAESNRRKTNSAQVIGVLPEDRRASVQRHPSQGPRPTFKMKPSGSRRRGGGSREEGAGTETGKQIRQGFEGIAEGLAKAFAAAGTGLPTKAPPKRERPTIKMNPNKRERSGALRRGDKRHEPLPPGRPNDSKKVRGVEPEERERTPTETGQNLANLMGSIVKESTTGKRYVEEGTEGQPGVVEVTGATAHEYSHQVQDIRDASPGGFIEGVAKLPDAPSMRAKGSRVHFDAGHT